MPNWDNDDDFDFDNQQEKIRARRKLYGTRVDEQKMWNGKPVKDMETDHIMNSLMFCEKRFVDAFTAHSECFNGEEDFYFKNVYEMFPDYRNLRDEWARRNRE